jgi:hypothetical protein
MALLPNSDLLIWLRYHPWRYRPYDLGIGLVLFLCNNSINTVVLEDIDP